MKLLRPIGLFVLAFFLQMAATVMGVSLRHGVSLLLIALVLLLFDEETEGLVPIFGVVGGVLLDAVVGTEPFLYAIAYGLSSWGLLYLHRRLRSLSIFGAALLYSVNRVMLGVLTGILTALRSPMTGPSFRGVLFGEHLIVGSFITGAIVLAMVLYERRRVDG